MTANAMIWNQVLSGAIPLFLCCTAPVCVGPSSASFGGLNLMDVLIGFDVWGRHVLLQYPLMKEALGRWSRSLPGGARDPFADLSPMQALQYGFAASVIFAGCSHDNNISSVSNDQGDHGEMSLVSLRLHSGHPAVWRVVSSLIAEAAKLYTSPYMLMSTQVCVISLLHSMFLNLQYLDGLSDHSDERYQIRFFAETVITHLAEQKIMRDLAFYFSLTIKSSLSNALAEAVGSRPISSHISLEYVNQCCVGFSGLLFATREHISRVAHWREEKGAILDITIQTLDELCSLLLNALERNSSISLLILQCCQHLIAALALAHAPGLSGRSLVQLSPPQLTVLLRLCQTVNESESVSAEYFKDDAICVLEDCTGSQCPMLLSDVIASCSALHGKFTSNWLLAKWSVIKSGLALIMAQSSIPAANGDTTESGVLSRSGNQTTLLISILKDINNSIEFCPLLSLTEIVSCCHSIIINLVGSVNDGGDIFENRMAADILDSCWRACIGGGGSLHTATVFTFIKLLFCPHMLARHSVLPIMVRSSFACTISLNEFSLHFNHCLGIL